MNDVSNAPCLTPVRPCVPAALLATAASGNLAVLSGGNPHGAAPDGEGPAGAVSQSPFAAMAEPIVAAGATEEDPVQPPVITRGILLAKFCHIPP